MTTDDVIRSLVCILAIDGSISPPEKQFLQRIQTRLKVSPEVLNAALEQATQGKGRVELPEESMERGRMFDLLVRAAVADGRIDPQERRVLHAVVDRIGFSNADLELRLATELKRRKQQRSPSQAPKAAPGRQPAASPPPQVCPKCGFRQDASRTSCHRCGVIFQQYRGAEAPESAPDDPDSAAARLERLKQHSIRLKLWGGVVIVTVLVILPAFLGIWQMEGSYRLLLLAGLVVLTFLLYGAVFFYDRLGVKTTGYILTRKMRRDLNNWASRHYRYSVRYEYEVAGRTYTARASVNHFHYSRLTEGTPVRVRYLAILPGISWLELW
jgi:uncharacterized tellurite resistance protein B-like protein